MTTINFNALQYAPEQPEDEETNSYRLWVRACQLHNENVEKAKADYKQAYLDSHAKIAEIKSEVERLRNVYKMLECLPKPVLKD